METESWQEWLLLAGLILVCALVSAAEVAISSVAARPHLRQELEQDRRRLARLLLRLSEDSSRLLATVRIGVTLSGFFAAARVALTFRPQVAQWFRSSSWFGFSERASQNWAFFSVTFLLACLMLLFGELLPKSLADRHPHFVALAVAWPMQVLSWLFYPLVRFLSGVGGLVTRLVGHKQPRSLVFVTQEEIRTLVDAGEEGGTIEPEEKEMISGILEMGKTLVREVMVPRTDIVPLEVGTPLLEALDTIVRAGYSRIPVYRETIDHIVGLLYAKDLLPLVRNGRQNLELESLLRPAHFIPETKFVDDLLREMQRHRIHMAIVVDEYGGTAGLATIEDLLEEIVGEIQDEYDSEEPLVQDLGSGEYLFDARLAVDAANKLAHLGIPEGDFDTLGGFIYERLGAIPKVGDQIAIGDSTITVASIQGLRPGKLHVRQLSGDVDTKELRDGQERNLSPEEGDDG